MKTYSRQSGREDFSRELHGERLPELAEAPKRRARPLPVLVKTGRAASPIPAKNPRKNALARREILDEEPRERHIDPVKYLKKASPKIIREFEELAAERGSGFSKERAECLEERAKNWSEFRFGNMMFIFREREFIHKGTDTYEKYAEAERKLCEETYELGGYFLSKKDWLGAYGCFKVLMQAYLEGKGEGITRQMGEDATRKSMLIARMWVFAYASELADLDIGKFKCFLDGVRELYSPDDAVQEVLGKSGRIDDLPAISVIGSNCWEGGMEAYCSSAFNSIRTRESLRFILTGMTWEKKDELGIGGEGLTDEQLVYRLSFLMKHLGLGSLLAFHPAFGKFGGGVFGAISPLMENLSINKILEGRLGREFTADPCMHEDAGGMHVAMDFLKQREFIYLTSDPEELVVRKYALTEKGKVLVTELFESIKTIKISC